MTQRLFKAREDHEYEVEAWFERDRKHLALTHPSRKKPIVELWDDEVNQAVDNGFLALPHHPRPTTEMWRAPLLGYARSYQLIR